MMSPYDLVTAEKNDIWTRLAAPVPQEAISWRKDGNVILRDDKFMARYVAYIEANTVRERLDSVAPGEWDLFLELLPPIPAADGDEPNCAFRARLQVRGVVREDVGMGRDYKQAATDAFKRAAVRFGVAHELYSYENNWVEMDGDGRNARPLEDPQEAYDRRFGGRPLNAIAPAPSALPSTRAPSNRMRSKASSDVPDCPKCGGMMWDNRATKRNPNAPDFRCRNRGCDAVIWPTRLAPVGERGVDRATAGETTTEERNASPAALEANESF
jgi:hypothetical protein